MAIEALVRKMLSGERPLPGARAGTDALNLADYDRLFRSKTIYTGFRREEPDVSLFRQLRHGLR